MKPTTLCFLVKKDGNAISHVCLAMKKRGFGQGYWNGAGGKVDLGSGETVEQAAIREAQEEFGVTITEFVKVADKRFYFENKPEWDQHCTVYLVTKWNGEPHESEEMKPDWFRIEDIPFHSMWEGDDQWIPLILEDKLIRSEMTFDANAKFLKANIKVVRSL